MKAFSYSQFHLTNRTVLLRVDYNIPLIKNKVADASKIKTSIPIIKFLLTKKCKIIIATHLGRPNGKIVNDLKLNAISSILKKLLPQEIIIKLNDCIGRDIKNKIEKAKNARIFLLENLRFYKEEEENNPAFAHSLANLAQIYINDAFSNSHRAHASMDAITHFLPSLTGPQLEKEVFYLSKALKPKKPAIWIMGGAKLDKVDLINQALKKSNKVLIGGALAFPFLKAKGYKVGMSKSDSNSTEIARKILKKFSARKLVLPLDFVVADSFKPNAKTSIVDYNKIGLNQMALDLGPKTIALFKKHLQSAKTVVWNGPLGYCEWAKFAQSTKEIGRFLGNLEVIKIAGGGETAEVINKFYLSHNFTHVSTAGGAALTFLSGKELPALKALEKNYKQFSKRKN